MISTWHLTIISAFKAAKSSGNAWCSNLTWPVSIKSDFKLLKVSLWKFAQWGQVKEENTFTVTLALESPMSKYAFQLSEKLTSKK